MPRTNTSNVGNNGIVSNSSHASLTFTQMKSLRNNNTAAWLNNIQDDPTNARLHTSIAVTATTQYRSLSTGTPTREHINRYTKDIGAWAEKVDRDDTAENKHLDVNLETVKAPRKDIEKLLRDVNDTFHHAEGAKRK